MDWMLDETAHAGPEHLDPAFVAGYDRKQGFPSPQPAIDALRRFDALGPVVVDLAAGTGRFAVAAAEHCERVIAVDVSPVMVASIVDRPNLTVVNAGFLSYEHTGPPADAAHTRNALHQLPDFWKGVALDRIARILRPGGILVLEDLIYDLEPSEAAAVFGGWFAGASADPAAGYTAGDYAEHIRTEFSTYRWLLEPLLDRTGFEILETDFRGRLYATYVCRRR